jgi:hypothetical protein
MQVQLAVRIDAGNPDHHLLNNHGTWWMHYTLDLGGLRTKRVRRSLGTTDRTEARRPRDALFQGFGPALVGGSL